jgi:sugar phosphate isomerase/epimerase
MYTVFANFHNGVNATVEELVPLLKKYGIEGIAAPDGLMENKKAALEAGKLVRDNGLRWYLMPTPLDFYVEDISDEEFDKGIETLKEWADIGEKMGFKYSYNHFWSGSNSRDYEENFEWNVTRMRRVWKVFNDHGIKYGLEYLGPHPLRNSFKYPFFNTISGALALADEVDPTCGFLFDSYHWFLGSGMNMGDLFYAANHAERMVALHLNDGIAGRTPEQQEDMERAMPLTTGVIPSDIPYRFFKKSTFNGPVICEPMFPYIGEQKDKPLETVVKNLADAFKRVEEAASR